MIQPVAGMLIGLGKGHGGKDEVKSKGHQCRGGGAFVEKGVAKDEIVDEKKEQADGVGQD